MRKILVVEDDEFTREGLKELLDCLNLECKTASTIGEAKAKAIEFMPNIVYIDVSLGKESGLDLVSWFRECFHPCPKLIVSSALPASKVVGENFRGDYFLAKPFGIDTIEQIVIDKNH